MKTLTIDAMCWAGGKNETNYGGAIACGSAAFLVVLGIVATGASGGIGLFLGSFIVSNAAMAWTCITAA